MRKHRVMLVEQPVNKTAYIPHNFLCQLSCRHSCLSQKPFTMNVVELYNTNRRAASRRTLRLNRNRWRHGRITHLRQTRTRRTHRSRQLRCNDCPTYSYHRALANRRQVHEGTPSPQLHLQRTRFTDRSLIECEREPHAKPPASQTNSRAFLHLCADFDGALRCFFQEHIIGKASGVRVFRIINFRTVFKPGAL